MNDQLLPGVSLEQGPADWQILQQDATGSATVVLAGRYRCDAPCCRIEARVVFEASGAPLSTRCDWQTASADEACRWQLVLKDVPAGGPYRLESRVRREGAADNRPMRGDYVHHWGVGDVWLIAGQSNAAGSGSGTVDDPPTFGVHQWGSDNRWKIAAHPLEDATRTAYPILVHGVAHGHSPWLAFGRLLQTELGFPIGLIPSAFGGSTIGRWQPGADLFENMIHMVRAAGGRIRGIVWYQGESDAIAMGQSEYAESFKSFVLAVRDRLAQPTLPVISAQLATYTGHAGDVALNDAWTEMREIQRVLAADFLHTPLVPTVDLQLGDFIHLSASANLVLGRRFADAVLRVVYYRERAEPGIALRGVAWIKPHRLILELQFERPISGWLLTQPCSDFSVRDINGPVEIARVELSDSGVVRLHLARQPEAPAMVTAHAGCQPTPALRDHDQRPMHAFSAILK